jgi:hypothetical protein
MAKPNTLTMIKAHAELTQTLAAAITAALEAGMSKQDAAAVLSRLVEIIESED